MPCVAASVYAASYTAPYLLRSLVGVPPHLHRLQCAQSDHLQPPPLEFRNLCVRARIYHRVRHHIVCLETVKWNNHPSPRRGRGGITGYGCIGRGCVGGVLGVGRLGALSGQRPREVAPACLAIAGGCGRARGRV